MTLEYPLRKAQRDALLFLRFEAFHPYVSKGFQRGNRSWSTHGPEGTIKIHGHIVRSLEERGLLKQHLDMSNQAIPFVRSSLTEAGRTTAEALRAEEKRATKKKVASKGRGAGRLSKGWHRRHDKEIIALYGEGKGMSVVELAHEFKVRETTIRRLLRQDGVMEPAKPWPEHMKDYYRTQRYKSGPQKSGDSEPSERPPNKVPRPTRSFDVLSQMSLNGYKIVVTGDGKVTLIETDETISPAFLARLLKAGYIELTFSNEEGWKHYLITENGSAAADKASREGTLKVPLPR